MATALTGSSHRGRRRWCGPPSLWKLKLFWPWTTWLLAHEPSPLVSTRLSLTYRRHWATCCCTQCYYLDPIKRSVSHPFSLRMPKRKVCERLKKDNPEICEVRLAPSSKL